MKRVFVMGELTIKNVTDVIDKDEDDVSYNQKRSCLFAVVSLLGYSLTQYFSNPIPLLPLTRHSQPPHFERRTDAVTPKAKH